MPLPNPLATVSALIPSFAVDYVAIFDQDYNQLFTNARAVKAVVKEQSKLMEHPIESGAIITDHRIILPVEIDLSLILSSVDYVDVYKAIRQNYYAATLLVVQTRAGVYENQIISAMPHEEDPTMFDAITIALSLKQVQYVRAQYVVNPRHPSNASTVARGTQQGTPATPVQASFFKQAISGDIHL